MQANVSKQADIDRLFAETKKAFGRLDILVNNAGIYEFAPLEEITAEHFHKQFDLNVLGLILAIAGGGRAVRPRGREHHQHQLGRRPSPRRRPPRSTAPPRRPSTPSPRSLAKELGPRKIRVNSINPGMVETEGVHAAGIPRDATSASRSSPQTPLGRIGQPDDIAAGRRLPRLRRFAVDHRLDLPRRGRLGLNRVRGRVSNEGEVSSLARSSRPSAARSGSAGVGADDLAAGDGRERW